MHIKNTKNLHKKHTIKIKFMKQTEILAAITGTEDEIKAKPQELVKYEKIEGSPFTIVTRENESMLTMGRYLVSPKLENEEEVKIWMKNNEWNLKTTVALIIAEDTMKQYESRIQNKNNNSL